MSEVFPMVPLGDVLTKSVERINLNPDERYRQVTVRLWGKGVLLRDEVNGVDIGASKRFVVRSQQFILSRIDARNGAFGLVPDYLDGAVVSSDFPAFTVDPLQITPKFLEWMSKTHFFVELCKTASEGTTNRVRLKEDRFLATKIPLPSLEEQRRIVAHIEELAAKIEEARTLKQSIEKELYQMLLSVFNNLIVDAEFQSMSEIAPITRRKIEVEIDGNYSELGVRSFGKGTFHKPTLSGLDVGSKKLYRIESGDLVFSNVFAWEGAVAVAKPKDNNRVGSHRFITCVPKESLASAMFLCFYFLTDEGLEKLGEASPGGAGRNRTLGLKSLGKIEVPIPRYEKQIWFDGLQAMVGDTRRFIVETTSELDALLLAVLDKAFKGELK